MGGGTGSPATDRVVATSQTLLTNTATEMELNMATRDELFPSRWLRASDIERPVVATIEKCETQTVGQGSKAERKLVAYFTGSTLKPLPFNKTNFNAVAEIAGCDDSDGWAGTTIELFAADVSGPNGLTRGIRIRRPRAIRQTKTSSKPGVPTATDALEDALTSELR
jgi:hypothetical protein